MNRVANPFTATTSQKHAGESDRKTAQPVSISSADTSSSTAAPFVEGLISPYWRCWFLAVGLHFGLQYAFVLHVGWKWVPQPRHGLV